MKIVSHYLYESVTGVYDLYVCSDHKENVRFFKRVCGGALIEISQNEFENVLIGHSYF